MAVAQEVRNAPTTVHLEPVRHNQDTLKKWIEWINDPQIRRWMYSDLPTSPEDINEWLYSATHDERRHYFSIVTDGQMIGFVSLRQDHEPASTGEIGIVIGEKEYQGRGIGTSAVNTVLAYAKEAVGLTSVRANIKPDNEKSIRLFTKTGFLPKGQVTLSGTPMMKFEKVL